MDVDDCWNKERSRSPIALKIAAEHDTSKDGIVRYMYWMKARSIPKYETPFQKVRLLSFIHVW